MKTRIYENDPKEGPTPDQRKALRDLLEKGIISQAKIEELETWPHEVVTREMTRLMHGIRNRGAGINYWPAFRRKILDKLGPIIGKRVLIRQRGKGLIETVVRGITHDYKVVCEGLKSPIQPMAILRVLPS